MKDMPLKKRRAKPRMNLCASKPVQDIRLPEWAEVMWNDARHFAFYGGRAGGKTRSIATTLVLQATQRHERVLCGREIQRSIRDSVKRVIDDEIIRCGLTHDFTITANEIRGPHESLFLFAGLHGQASAIRSIEGITCFWGEEAQNFSQASIDTVIPSVRAPFSRLIWSWNPHDPADPVDQLFRGPSGPPPRSIVRSVNHHDNPWFPDELKQEMLWDRARDIDKYRHIWEGEYRINSEARVFRNWSIEDFSSPMEADYRLGADFGFAADPSVAIRARIDDKRIFLDYEAWGLGVEIIDLPALFRTIPDAEKYGMTADSSRPETISHLRSHGFPKINSAIKGARSLDEGVAFLKSYDLIVHPRCRHLIDELVHYSWRTDPLTGQILAVLEDRHNHAIDALRYAVEGVRRAQAKPKRANVMSPPTSVTGFGRVPS